MSKRRENLQVSVFKAVQEVINKLLIFPLKEKYMRFSGSANSL